MSPSGIGLCNMPAVAEPPDWPVDARAIEAARAFLANAAPPVAIACHSDVDGLCAAVLIRRALDAHGIASTTIVSRRGEHVHTESMRQRIRDARPAALVVADMGSRPLPVGAGVPTLIIDHHHAANGVPPDAVVVNGHDRPPVASSSALAFAVCRDLPGFERWCWLARLGALADMATGPEIDRLLGCRGSGRTWSEAAALLNAPRRAHADDGDAALAVLLSASAVSDIAGGSVAGVGKLQEYRAEVRAESARCSRVAPRRIGDAWLIRFASGAQVHPLVATMWTKRLAPAIVLVANDGFISGRVNFVVRCAAAIDLVAWLKALPFVPPPGAEFANGHARATGGSLPAGDFDRFLAAVAADRHATGDVATEASSTRRRGNKAAPR